MVSFPFLMSFDVAVATESRARLALSGAQILCRRLDALVYFYQLLREALS